MCVFMHVLFNLGWQLAQDGPCDTSTLGQQLCLGGGAATTKPVGLSQAFQLARQQSHIRFYLAIYFDILYEIHDNSIPFVWGPFLDGHLRLTKQASG